jgi:hypothetical protein
MFLHVSSFPLQVKKGSCGAPSGAEQAKTFFSMKQTFVTAKDMTALQALSFAQTFAKR